MLKSTELQQECEGNLVLAPTGLFTDALKMSMAVVSLLINAVDCIPQYSLQYSGK